MDNLRCDICNKDFGDAEALAAHNFAKHKKHKHSLHTDVTKSRRTFFKKVIYVVIILLLITGSFFVYNVVFNKKSKSTNYDDFAKYLTESGAIMYGTEWCSHCKTQKSFFADSFKYVNFVDCDKQAATCSAAGITGYPTWIINEQKYSGAQTIERLMQLTGYAPNKTLVDVINATESNVQIATLYVSGSKYVLEPSTFKKNIPVKIVADISRMPGCSKAVTIPAFRVLDYVDTKDNTILFTPTKTGIFSIACSMSMYTGLFNVVD